MARLSITETKQEFLQKLRTKIREQEITEKDLIIILLEEKAKCYACNREITKQELAKLKKDLGLHQKFLISQWEKEINHSPNIQQVIKQFDKVRIKH